MVKFFILTTIYILSSISTSYAQETPVLDLKNSGAMGFVPVYPRPITSNNVNDLKVNTVELDPDRTVSALGCGAIDNVELRRSILNNSDGNEVEDYLDTNFANYLVTTLYNSPAIAKIYDAVENFASPRVKEIQDRCAAMEYKDDLAPVQWQAVQQCINKHVEKAGNDNRETLADAFRYCLSSPDADGSVVSLRESTEDVLKSEKWNGSLFSALKNTRACVSVEYNGVSEKRCDLFAFIPNVRWCSASNKADYEHCYDETGTSVSNDMIISPEAISPVQIFDAAFGVTEAFVNYAMVYAKKLVEKSGGMSKAVDIAMIGENKSTDSNHISSIATEGDVMNGSPGTGAELDNSALAGAQFKPQAFDIDFANYINCGATFDKNIAPRGDFLWEDFNSIVGGLRIGNNSDLLKDSLPKPLAPGYIYGDFFDKNEIYNSDTSIGSSGSTIRNVFDPVYARNIIVVAAKCVVRDELRLTLNDYLSLLNFPKSSDAALLGYRVQVAYAVTRDIISYIIDKLELAKMDLAFNVLSDSKSPPPHVTKAIDSIINSLNKKMSLMENRRNQQKDYAKFIAKLSAM